jgi:hypothetical protein
MANEAMNKLSGARDVLNDFHQQMALLDSLGLVRLQGARRAPDRRIHLLHFHIHGGCRGAARGQLLAVKRKRRAVAGSPRRRRREANLGHG